MENPKKPATYGTQDEENTKHKHNINVYAGISFSSPLPI
jgi:hypothetical protein